ncbi:Tautomerase/MIF superfamily [Dunaliella salina]|uniref:L-dopachrome isomerase n=1 Tax=Dunaliella salina TaxID=3046 RepID=A0ABQ7FZG0_DUNSA|nr:Tautomerase/MIF superfamily [Dunaliella salina]|eukprot:KAF5827738.1 Tautomerase/MIF superfamily [Dunaliella salina]
MPVLKVITNVRPFKPTVPVPKPVGTPQKPVKPPVVTGVDMGHPDGLLKDLSTAVTTGIGKPEAYVCCTVTLDQPIIFGGTEDPAAFADIHSIGSIGGEKNKQISAKVAAVLEEKLGIPSNRFYMQFHDSAPSDFGFKGSTF